MDEDDAFGPIVILGHLLLVGREIMEAFNGSSSEQVPADVSIDQQTDVSAEAPGQTWSCSGGGVHGEVRRTRFD